MGTDGLRKILIISLASIVTYMLISLIFDIPFLSYIEMPWMHEFRVFTSFLMVPLFMLYLLDGEIFPIYTGRDSFTIGIGIYLCFVPLIFLLFPHSDFITSRSQEDIMFLSLMVSINVIPVDFFTKRVVQHEISIKYGAYTAILVSIGIWIIGHYIEIMWLTSIGGPVAALIFIISTGIATAIIYEVTKDVSGQMAGHILINIVLILLW